MAAHARANDITVHCPKCSDVTPPYLCISSNVPVQTYFSSPASSTWLHAPSHGNMEPKPACASDGCKFPLAPPQPGRVCACVRVQDRLTGTDILLLPFTSLRVRRSRQRWFLVPFATKCQSSMLKTNIELRPQTPLVPVRFGPTAVPGATSAPPATLCCPASGPGAAGARGRCRGKWGEFTSGPMLRNYQRKEAKGRRFLCASLASSTAVGKTRTF